MARKTLHPIWSSFTMARKTLHPIWSSNFIQSEMTEIAEQHNI